MRKNATLARVAADWGRCALISMFTLSALSTARASDDGLELPGQELAERGRALRDTAPPVRDVPSIPSGLDATDAVAVLEGIRIALSEVADGSTYVWHRKDGRLSGMAQPMTSFKDAYGQPCRRLVVVLNTPARSSKVEGIACRMADRRWNLSG
jgi:hypothetical protein